jgi:hypothetical protein
MDDWVEAIVKNTAPPTQKKITLSDWVKVKLTAYRDELVTAVSEQPFLFSQGASRSSGFIKDELTPGKMTGDAQVRLTTPSDQEKARLIQSATFPDPFVSKDMYDAQKRLADGAMSGMTFTFKFLRTGSDRGREIIRKWAHINTSVTYASKGDLRYAEWLEDMAMRGYSFIENDFAAFDGTLADVQLEVQDRVLRRVGGPRLKNYLKAVRKTVGKIFKAVWGLRTLLIKYKTGAQRRSGDSHTSIGNSIVCAAVMTYILAQLGCTEFHILDLGDDSVVAYRRSQLAHLSDNQLKKEVIRLAQDWGMEAEPLVIADYEEVSFCSMNAWRASPKQRLSLEEGGLGLNASIIMVPKVGRILTKWGVLRFKSQLRFEEQMATWSVASADRLKHDANVPIISVLEGRYAPAALAEWRDPATLATNREWFKKRYDVDVEEQLLIEAQILSGRMVAPDWFAAKIWSVERGSQAPASDLSTNVQIENMLTWVAESPAIQELLATRCKPNRQRFLTLRASMRRCIALFQRFHAGSPIPCPREERARERGYGQ